MSSSRTPLSRKSPLELLIPAAATPSPSAASHGSTDSEPIDLTTEDLSGAATMEFTGGTLSCIWDNDRIEFFMVEGENGWKCKWCGKLFKLGTPQGQCCTCSKLLGMAL